MAQSNVQVFLGYEDEQITEKYKNQVNFTTNKIGGKPDLPSNIILDIPPCPLCQLPRPMVVQIYAPLDNSPYHRTLYLFGCINPNCWNQSDSWQCVRTQTLDTVEDNYDNESACSKQTSAKDWCSGADDWDDDNANLTERNGNVLPEKCSDDDESCSFEESIRSALGNLQVDDRNANNGAMRGAVGRLHSPSATAEIEGNEGEVISIDSPIFPQRNISALMQEAAPPPVHLFQNTAAASNRSIEFQSFFMSFGEENASNAMHKTSEDSHVRELLQHYQQHNVEEVQMREMGGGAADAEKYEQSAPAHGDKMFHCFLSRIQKNPGQLLRYTRDSEPLLLHPLQEQQLPKCPHCQGERRFEMQILSTIIPKLRLSTDTDRCCRFDFGTVLVFTCSNSCWPTGTSYRCETVILQSEN